PSVYDPHVRHHVDTGDWAERLRLVLAGAGRDAGHLARPRQWLRQPRPLSGLRARLDQRLARRSECGGWHSRFSIGPRAVGVPDTLPPGDSTNLFVCPPALLS